MKLFLRGRVMLISVVILATALALFIKVSSDHVRDDHVHHLMKIGAQVADQVAYRIQSAALQTDEWRTLEDVRASCHLAAKATDGVARVVFSVTQGRAICDSSRPITEIYDSSIVDQPFDTVQLEDFYVDSRPVRLLSGVLAGSVVVLIPRDILYAHQQGLTQTLMIYGVLLVVLCSGLLFAALTVMVEWPTRALLNYIECVNPHKMEAMPSPPPHRADELGVIASAFHQLICRLLATQQELTSVNRQLLIQQRNLEETVRERTWELTDANVKLGLLARTDALTDLPNRFCFNESLERRYHQVIRHHRPLALMLLDLDGFKAVNDSFGHAAGDETLRYVAERLRRNCRGGDTIARLGGDEFVIMVEDFKSIAELRALADKLVAEVSEPISIRDQKLQIGVSIGIALLDLGSAEVDTTEALMSRADHAMYHAKTQRLGVVFADHPEAHAV